MAVGDVSISDSRYFGIAAEPASGSPTYVDMSAALLSCDAKIMFEVIDSEYAFGEEGRKSAVSTHYTWMADVRLRVDQATLTGTPALGDVLEVIAAGARNPISSTPKPTNVTYTGPGSGRFAVEIGEYGSTATVGNPVYSGIVTLSEVSFLFSDSTTPATERILDLSFKGSGNLTRDPEPA